MQNSDFNRQQYSKYFDQYLESNTDGGIGGGSIQERVSLFSRYVPKGCEIFEIGSGGGNEAVVLEDAGYNVLASDFVDEFVEIMKYKGLKVIKFDAKKDEIPENISAVYANAVFVHFPPQEIEAFLKRISNKLINEKVVFMSLIKGTGSEISKRGRGFEREFYYYSEDQLEEIVRKAGFHILYSNALDEKWIQIVASCGTTTNVYQ